MATFVLVTGQQCGAWSWKKVIPLLRAAGHEVTSPTADNPAYGWAIFPR